MLVDFLTFNSYINLTNESINSLRSDTILHSLFQSSTVVRDISMRDSTNQYLLNLMEDFKMI